MRRFHSQAGATTLIVLLIALVFVAVGGFLLLAVDRNIELRAIFQRNVSAFYAAEAGLNYGALGVKNTLLSFGVPTDCRPETIEVGGHSVTYRLSGCGQVPVARTVQDPPYQGLNGIVYTYTLNSKAVNRAGSAEAVLDMEFEANLVPMFQFGILFKGDLESLPATPSIISGRIYAGGDLYLNSDDCATGQRIAGQLAIAGHLIRGRKDSDTNANHVWIDNPRGDPQILGAQAAGSQTCTPAARRTAEASETAAWGGRIMTGVGSMTLPDAQALLCSPWSCPGSSSHGVYWDRASLRIVLDTTVREQLLPGGSAPLYPVTVVDANGAVDPAKTAAIQAFMRTTPGAITYSDVPVRNQDCRARPNCEAIYASPTAYAPAFPEGPAGSPCLSRRAPREKITPLNYCYDYRYGGFYNWRESKPILMLNVDWMALDEWNLQHGRVLFDPTAADASPNRGVVVFLSVKGLGAQGANPYGVRIYDASRVRHDTADAGATFATDMAAYLVGNFNCPAPTTASDAAPPSCGGSGAAKPTSIVADTVNVLSCAWVDNHAQACGTVKMDSDQWPGVGAYRLMDERSTQPAAAGFPAQPTVVSAAVLAGGDDTWCPTDPTGRDCGQAWYGGGLENFLRLHEQWGGQPFRYRGALVRLGTPRHTCFAFTAQLTAGVANDPAFTCSAHAPQQGFWSQQRFAPPLSRLFYDTSFDDVIHLPPLTPRVGFVTQHWLVEAGSPAASAPAVGATTPPASTGSPVQAAAPPGPPASGAPVTPPAPSRVLAPPRESRPAARAQGPVQSQVSSRGQAAPPISTTQTGSAPPPPVSPSVPGRASAALDARSVPSAVTPPSPSVADRRTENRPVPGETRPSPQPPSPAVANRAAATRSPREGPESQPTPTPSLGYHVQLGVFAHRENAEALARQARARGYAASIVDSGNPLYRVWVGRDLNRSAAERLATSLRADGFETILKP